MGRSEHSRRAGFTLVELVITITVVAILAGMALPLARNSIIREKEIELRRALRDMREAIDAYKEDADLGEIDISDDTEGYPPNLETLVEGVPLTSAEGGTRRYLRKIPEDPMTGMDTWRTNSSLDSPGLSSGGQNVFDVYSYSDEVALDGTQYSEW